MLETDLNRESRYFILFVSTPIGASAGSVGHGERRPLWKASEAHRFFYEAAFQDAIDEGQKLYAVDVDEYRCIEIDTVEDIENAEKMVARYIDNIT